jgi:hypothetical protein
MDEYCGIDEIVHGSGGDGIDEKMFMQMGMDEMFWNYLNVIVYKWMNEKMHGWMDGLMI